MFYLGIGIGKSRHEAALLSDTEEVLWRYGFRPTRTALQGLAERLCGLDPTQLEVGLEATGPYWLTVHNWLLRWGSPHVRILNPLQTRAFRNAHLRGAKTDRVDAVLIARLLRWAGQTLSAHPVPDEQRQAAREINRMRTEMLQLRGGELGKLDGILSRVFPEFRDAFPKLGIQSALRLLLRWPTPALLTRASEAEIAQLLTEVSRGRLGLEKARTLLRLCESSVGVPDPLDASAAAIRARVAHVLHLEEQIESLAQLLDRLLESEGETRQLLESIPGVGEETARVWVCESPPMEQFRAKNGAERLVASIGLDAQLSASGQFMGRAKMSKRGNRYLRRSIVLAARVAARKDPQFRAILNRQLTRGKHYNVAMSHVARKLVHVIYSVLLNRRPYAVPAEYRLGIIEAPIAVAEA